MKLKVTLLVEIEDAVVAQAFIDRPEQMMDEMNSEYFAWGNDAAIDIKTEAVSNDTTKL